MQIPKKSRRRSRGFGRQRGAGGPERLEVRQVFSGAPLTGEACVVSWNGREISAVRDSYILRMPQTNVATSQGLWDYASVTPAVEASWSIRPLGMGYFSIETPGASPADVRTWSSLVGASTISPNSLLEKQAVPRKLSNDPRFVEGQQWGLDNNGQAAGANTPVKVDADIDAPEAWRIDPVNQNTGSRNIVVAILDDGIDYTHPDLQANMWQRPANVPSSLSGRFGFDVANRLADGTYDVDIPERNYYCTMPGNPNDIHGTAIAGIIGAKGNNNRGLTGVNWDVSMLSANIFKDGGQYSSNADFVEAVNRIIRLRTQFGVNIAVVNASWMSVSFNDAPTGDGVMSVAVANLSRAGILFVTAAGNGYDLGGDFVGDLNDGDTDPCPQVWPGNYYAVNPAVWGNVITVGASTPADTLARFSNFSTTNVHIAAPGVNIWTTVPLKARDLGATDYQSHESIQSDPRLAFQRFDPWSQTPSGITGGYAQLSGTSMSTAFVTGVAALAAAEYRRWTGELPSVDYLRSAVIDQADVVATLTYTETVGAKPDILGRMTVDPLNHLEHSIEGNRRLNAYNTVKWVRENLPPKVTFSSTSVVEGDTGTTAVVIQATLSTESLVPLTIRYWTESYRNDAVDGVDFVAIPASAPLTFIIPAGETSASVTLPGLVIGDTSFESNEKFMVRFGLPVNSNAWLGSKSLSVTIVNDDSSAGFPAAMLDPTEILVNEGDGGSARPTIINVPVTLDITPARTIFVPYEVTSVARAGVALPVGSAVASPAVDYVALAGTLRFNAGQTSAIIPVRILGDTVVAGTSGEAALESFAVRILQPNPGMLRAGRSVKIVTISDDDTLPPPDPPPTPVVSVLQPVDVSVVRGAVATLPVFLDGEVPAGYVVSIFYRTVTGGTSGGNAVSGADFRGVASGRLVIPAGETLAAINVETFANAFATYPRRFFVEITGAVYSKVPSTSPADSIRIDIGGLGPVMVTITD